MGFGDNYAIIPEWSPNNICCGPPLGSVNPLYTGVYTLPLLYVESVNLSMVYFDAFNLFLMENLIPRSEDTVCSL